MPKTPTLFLCALPVLCAVPVPMGVPLSAAVRGAGVQDGPDVARLLRDQVQNADKLSIDEMWNRVAGLRDLDRNLEAGGLDAATDSWLNGERELGGAATLFLVGLRLQGGDLDAPVLFEKLAPLVHSEHDEIAIGACGLLADPNFKTLGSDQRRELIGLLAKVAEDGNRDPELRLEAAHSLLEQGPGDDRRKAWKLMNSFLASSDPELRAQGALTLARSGFEVSGQLYQELRRLAALPGARGKLADSYLEAERQREYDLAQLRRKAQLLESRKSEDTGAKGMSPGEIFETVLRVVQTGHLEGDKVDEEDLLKAAMDGLLRSIDEHSAFMGNKEFSRFEQDLEAAYGGIGAYVVTSPDDNLFTITHPIYTGPAYKAGLMSEDKIVRVGDWPTLGEPTDEVIKRLKGRPGTSVKLYVWRRGMDPGLIDRPTEEMSVEIERAAIQIPAVQYQMLPGKIGMVALRDFSRVASAEIRAALLDLQAQGMQGFILDLRNNPGGLLDEAVAVASPFLPRGTKIVSTESRVEESETHFTQGEPIVPMDMPMVVLTNRYSASASEIVAGALQDHERAVLIGKRTFGKGSVQKLLTVPGMQNDLYDDENRNGRRDNWERITRDWNDNGEFDYAPHVKLTIARYLLPSGRSIHRELDADGAIVSPGGIEPDLNVDRAKIDSWRVEEMVKVRDTGLVRDYVDEHLEAYLDLFAELAENDKKDYSRYPDFDDLMARLNTPLPHDDVRQMLRYEIRRRIQDRRAKEFPPGDFVEDEQLQEGIRNVLAKLGMSPADLDEYDATIPEHSTARLTIAAVERASVEEALDQVSRARQGDGRLSLDMLRRLEELLQASLHQ
jgi:carboxyl-terminal processing protease